ncbi:OmpA/MotB domain protein [Pseudarthrobacter chlorophenolicus A6]|uniref:OmpA/MotB domain protein n=1 Tax=Pseudarthrobacter chlorophenolicus (strain ATCC 700700 / DSM 12829 / CIP 107037 / JCM 12360 / KCTC 9906 / NCIMB 13794 / A6) TaxID=452863 RepID=B8HEJ6_PSECP|nr:flagellar motor protein MotB [Pseudarthrobacter chlorophenolicus]ACL40941.1 OmpA/MotB domain protein [Pseudarthrobacter chlorophenolicus A6]SDQ72505.1 chemotaxis protein MotB [Pseudarthrobacter chlorophenolicus]
MKRRRRGGHEPEEEHVDERWMASYMDMVTVLMCMFIVLFAMSTVDQAKFDKLRNSLATGFGAVASQTADTASGTVVPPDQVNKDAEAFSSLDLAIKEVDKLTALQQQMETALKAQQLDSNVEFQISERGLTVKLVGSQAFFLPDRPELTRRASQVLDTISPTLAPAGLEIMVEGHAANGITAFPSTWELSSARSVNVLRYLVDRGGVAPGRIGAVAFGSARQVNDDSTEELMELNRRVDVVVLSDKAEAIRDLIPQAVDIEATRQP